MCKSMCLCVSHWNAAFRLLILFLSPVIFASCLSSAFVRVSSVIHWGVSFSSDLESLISIWGLGILPFIEITFPGKNGSPQIWDYFYFSLFWIYNILWPLEDTFSHWQLIFCSFKNIETVGGCIPGESSKNAEILTLNASNPMLLPYC